ncbi:MAG: hypothetical protein WA709_32995 [Stellaceae bacterium]
MLNSFSEGFDNSSLPIGFGLRKMPITRKHVLVQKTIKDGGFASGNA